MSKGGIAVCDGKDNDFSADNFRIKTEYLGGKFLKFDGNNFIATSSNDRTTNLKIRSVSGGNDCDWDLWIIIDIHDHFNSNSKALAMHCDDDGAYSFTVEEDPNIASITSLHDVKSSKLSNFLFKKVPLAGKSKFLLTSYNTTSDGKVLLLAVDEHGHLLLDDPPHKTESEIKYTEEEDHDPKHLFMLRPIVQ